jgi:hypothetical protein
MHKLQRLWPSKYHDWARLIRKLRWIGMDKEAKRLEMAVRTALHLEQRCGVSSQPFNTLADITM